MSARVVTAVVPGGEVNLWLFDSGDVEVSWRDEPGGLWRPVRPTDVKVEQAA